MADTTTFANTTQVLEAFRGIKKVTLEDVARATEMCERAAGSGKSDAKTHWLGVRE